MYTIAYRFFFGDIDVDSYVDKLWSHLAGLIKAGRMLNEPLNLTLVDDHILVSCVAPETGSIDHEALPDYAAGDYKWIVSHSVKAPEQEIIGRTLDLGDICDCASPSSYVLFTTFIQKSPPVLCGDCGVHVPLYRLPRFKDDSDYHSILSWEDSYQSCDHLNMGCRVGERFGMRQMRDPRSPLTKEGLEICRELAQKMSKPFYYYLDTSTERIVKRCPSCGKDWQRSEPLGRRFDLVCDDCRFVSISPPTHL